MGAIKNEITVEEMMNFVYWFQGRREDKFKKHGGFEHFPLGMIWNEYLVFKDLNLDDPEVQKKAIWDEIKKNGDAMEERMKKRGEL